MTRRDLLGGSLALAACRVAPAVRVPGPRITHGLQCGDPTDGGATIWARASEPARLIVEWDTTDRFANPRRGKPSLAVADRDLTATVTLAGLPPGQTVWYRARFERQAARGASDWQIGRLPTAHPDRVRLAWTGDTCGQGFGRNPEWGGLRGFAAIRAADPALFINSGDLMYADNPIPRQLTTSSGRIWRNETTERVARVAESLDDFRARFAYNFEDDHLRGLAAHCPTIAQWDDHETHNNWWPGQTLADDRYHERSIDVLAALARRAFAEWTPLATSTIHRVIHYGPLIDVFVLDCRSFRTPNDRNLAGEVGPPARFADQTMLGAAQLDGLLAELAASRARWKIIACDQPIALVIADDDIQEGFANGDRGPPRGRERELAWLLRAMAAATPPIRNVVWVTADVHYAAAHHFDPSRAAIGDFDPFWEFVAGPIHAGSFGPNPLDPTFGGEVRFQWAPEREIDTAPWGGLANFGLIDATARSLTVSIRDLNGHTKFSVEIPHVG